MKASTDRSPANAPGGRLPARADAGWASEAPAETKSPGATKNGAWLVKREAGRRHWSVTLGGKGYVAEHNVVTGQWWFESISGRRLYTESTLTRSIQRLCEQALAELEGTDA